MRCVFPQAVKSWQKALCGVLGVGLLGTGLTLGFYAMRKTVELTVSHPTEEEQRTAIRQRSKFETFLGQVDNRVYLGLGAPICAAGSVFCAVWTIKAPIKFWPELKEEFVTFYRTVRGTTQCCNIIRTGTAKFAIFGTQGVALLGFSVTLFPLASIYLGGTAYNMGKEFYEALK